MIARLPDPVWVATDESWWGGPVWRLRREVAVAEALPNKARYECLTVGEHDDGEACRTPVCLRCGTHLPPDYSL